MRQGAGSLELTLLLAWGSLSHLEPKDDHVSVFGQAQISCGWDTKLPNQDTSLQVPSRLLAAGLDGVGAEWRAEGPALPTDLRGPRRAGEAWPRGLRKRVHSHSHPFPVGGLGALPVLGAGLCTRESPVCVCRLEGSQS